MAEKLDLAQKLLCNKVGKMFEIAASKLECYEVSFCQQWLKSDLCKEIVAMEPTVICQSKVYFYNSIMSQVDLAVHKDYVMDAEAMYWMGYILTYWMYMENIDGETISELYDIREMFSQYDILHTMSPRVAIELIKRDCKKVY